MTVPLEIRKKTGMSAFTSLTQCSTESLSHSSQMRRRNERHPNWKGRSKTVFICRRHDTVHREPQRTRESPEEELNEMEASNLSDSLE